MWDNIGKQIQTFMLIFIVALLSVIMGVVGFGAPNAEGCNAEGPGYAAQVYDQTITEGDFRAAYTLTGFSTYPTERAQALRLKEFTLKGLVERSLLVREAHRLGFQADPEAIMREIVEDQVVYLGGPVDAPPGYPQGAIRQSFSDRDGNFTADYLERFIQYHLRRSVEEFIEWQVDEKLANRVREMVTATVTVSPREVWDSYVRESERARVSYARFDPEYYATRVETSDEAVTAWMAENQEAVDEEFRRQRHRYTNLPEQARVRHILIGVDSGASDEVRAEKRALAERLLAEIQGGGDFAALAREHSTDPGSASRGGVYDWTGRGTWVDAFEEAAFTTDAGNVVDHLVETQFGYHLMEVLGRREGDVDEDVAKREIADGLYSAARAGELAREDADRAIAYLAEGHSMEELDERLLHDWAAPEAPAVEAEGGDEADPEVADAEAPDAEEEPEARDRRAPQVRETRSFGRAERPIAGSFDSGPLAQAAFEIDMDDPIPSEPLEMGDSFFVYHVDERTEADLEDYTDETRDRISRTLLADKRLEVLSAYVGRLRSRAEADGALRENPAILSYGSGSDDAEAEEEPSEESASR